MSDMETPVYLSRFHQSCHIFQGPGFQPPLSPHFRDAETLFTRLSDYSPPVFSGSSGNATRQDEPGLGVLLGPDWNAWDRSKGTTLDQLSGARRILLLARKAKESALLPESGSNDVPRRRRVAWPPVRTAGSEV